MVILFRTVFLFKLLFLSSMTPLDVFSFLFQTFDANDLYQGQNFNKVLSSLVALNKVTAGKWNFACSSFKAWESLVQQACSLFGFDILAFIFS